MKVLLLFTGLILAATVTVAVSLSLLDNIVHRTLYNFGLHFSYEWASPYWTILRIIQASVGLTATFALIGTIYVYRKYIHAKPETKMTVSEKSAAAPSVAIEPPQPSISGLVKCVHCGRVFAQPLRMLDFHSDRPRIVNICPFCNEVIPPVFHQDASESGRKVVQKSKKDNDQAKGTRELQEMRQTQRKEETKETVATSA